MTGPLEHESTFEDVFDQMWPRIHRLLISIVGDPAEAEDLALEAFHRLHARSRLLKPGQNPGAWLYRVASNLGYNALRAARRRGRYEEAAGQDWLVARESDPEARLEQALAVRRVRRVLAEMKPRAARLLLLRHSGLSYAELAEVLEVSPGSIGPLLTRAERAFEQRYRMRYDDA